MKSYKLFIIAALSLAPAIMFGQNRYDALRFSRQQYEGTARTLGMGNAFTAIGGDLGAITINPAASGIYRYSEVSVTPGLTGSLSRASYLDNSSSSGRVGFGIPNAGWVGYFPTGRKTGLLNMNMSLITSQSNNYTSSTSAYGTESMTSWLTALAVNMPSGITGSDLTMPDDDPNYPFYYTNAPWKSILAWNSYLLETLSGTTDEFVAATENIYEDPDSHTNYYQIGGPLNQNFRQITTGYTQDFTVNVGGNVSNKFFFGVNLTVQSIWYKHTEYYSESAQDQNNFDTSFKYFQHSLHQTMDGIGYNIKAGIIYLPVAGLRIGASFSTPTWITMKDYSYESIEGQVYNKDYSCESPENQYQYRMNSPFRWNVGVAYTFAKKAIVSVDYEGVNYSSTKFIVSNTSSQSDYEYFTGENKSMSSDFRTVTNIRAGVELKVLPVLSLRGGYNFYDYTEKGYNDSKHYASLGLGYASGQSGFFIDAAYMQQCNYTDSSYTLYYYDTESGVPIVNERNLGWKVLLTIGVRF